MLERGPAVRRKLLFRSTRLELGLEPTIALDEPFVRDVGPALKVAYHLTNELSLGAFVGLNILQLETNLRKNIQAELQTSDPDSLDEISFTRTAWFADIEFSFVPLFGKFTLLNDLILNWDIHLLGGVGAVRTVAVGAVANAQLDDTLTAINVAPMIGFGARIFLSDALSLNIGLRNYLYPSSPISRGNADLEFSNHLIGSIGVGLFLPGEVKISR
jgi:outer membrane beta-barrel protein